MRFSVIVPTWNRSRVLGLTLDSLSRQDQAPEFEILVVDDGSTDDTRQTVFHRQTACPAPLHYLYQPNRKQGAARNLGARNASGDLLLLLGDDIVPTPRFLAEHDRAHRLLNPTPAEGSATVVGYTTWPPHFERTRFLEYIGEHGWQFGYALIEDPHDLPFNFFYTSNLSLPRARFLASGGFDESFQEYGWEDIELSFRLKASGMRIAYAPSAVAYHEHPTDFRRFTHRQLQVGRSAWSFARRQPKASDFLGLDRIPNYSRTQHWRFRLLSFLCEVTERSRWLDLSRFYPDLMTYFYMLGVIEGRDLKADHGSQTH